MQRQGIVGIVLIAAGVLGLLFAGGPGWGGPGWDGPGWKGRSGWWDCYHGSMMRGYWRHPMHGPWSGPWSGPGRAGQALPPVAGARTIDLAAGDFAFKPAEITVKAGETVNLQLINQGAVIHDLYLTAGGLWVVAQPGQTATAGIRFDRPGTYQFYCTVPGHAEAGMVGRVVVTP